MVSFLPSTVLNCRVKLFANRAWVERSSEVSWEKVLVIMCQSVIIHIYLFLHVVTCFCIYSPPHRFYWSCHPLRDEAKSCFNDSRTPVSMKRNQSVLKFQVDWLLEDDSFDSFEFLVTVAKDSRKSTASKVLIMNSAPGHLWVTSQVVTYFVHV